MFRKSVFSALLLALAIQSVRGKPACCSPCLTTPTPCSDPSSFPVKSDCANPPTSQRQPCSPKQQTQCVPCTLPNEPKIPKPCDEQKTTPASTTTTTSTTKRPTTTTTLAPSTTTTLATSTTTAYPKSNCANGEIYPANTGSCDQFLMCRNQMYVLMVCPPGFGYNTQMRSCDWSANVPACRAQS